MSSHVKCHRKQFLVSTSPDPPLPWFETRAVHGSFFLHQCPELPLRATVDGFVLGTCLGAANRVPTTTERLPGRWVVIGEQIFGDNGGALGIFYTTGDDAAPLVSSSPALLAAASGATRSGLRLYGGRPNWWPAPATAFDIIQRLLPDQLIVLADRTIRVEVCDHPLKRLDQGLVLEDRSREVLDRLTTSLQLAAESGSIKLALTSGFDSRTLFAAALNAGVDFETYTQSLPTDHPDVMVAMTLSDLFGIRHRHLEAGRTDRQVLRLFDEHTAGSSRDADRLFIARGLFEVFDRDDVLVRGNGFEIGAGVDDKFFGPASLEDVEQGLLELRRRFHIPPFSFAELREGFGLWLEHRLTHRYAVGMREAFHLDQRFASWVSATELGLDSIEPRSLHLSNDGAVMRCLVVPDRIGPPIGREVQRGVMELVDERLVAVPFNPSNGSRSGKLRGRSLRVMKMLIGEAVAAGERLGPDRLPLPWRR